jgi:uncharacterized protein YjdB
LTPPHIFRRAMLRPLGALVTLAALFAACSDGELFSPNRKTKAHLAIHPRIAATSAAVLAADINRLRLTVTLVPDGPTLPPAVLDVQPDAQSWDVPLEVPANSRISILVELLNVTGGVETVEFSGTLPVIEVGAGPQPTPPPIEVFPGPPGNLSITALSIAPGDTTIFVGGQVLYVPTVSGGSGQTRVLWTSSDPSTATVDAQGVVRGARAGRVTITAEAGRFSDAVEVTIASRAARIEIDPANPLITALDQDVTFTARALDANNQLVTAAQVSWSIADPTIATQVGPGVFRTRRSGTTTITASTTTGGTTVTENTTLRVEQRAIDFGIEPGGHFFDALGVTQQFTFQARDANGRPVDLAPTWTSDDPGVAAVSSTGLVTARANGSTIIRAATSAGSAQAHVTVQQGVATITISPPNVTLTSIGARRQLAAELRDPAGNAMTGKVTWASQTPGIVTVNSGGVVEAVGDGMGIIVASNGSARAAIGVLVQRVRRRVVIEGGDVTVSAGQTRQLTAFGADSAGVRIIANDTIQWTSTNPQVASVNASGLVTGMTNGSANIIATAYGFADTVRVTVGTTVGGPGFIGDADDFGRGIYNSSAHCVYYDLSDPVIDLNIFDREPPSGQDQNDVWTHDIRDQLQGRNAAEVIVEVREVFSDHTASTLEIDGQTFNFTTSGFSNCGPPIVQTFRFTGAAAAFANDGFVTLRFNENGDDIALDWARVTVIPEGNRVERRVYTQAANPQALTREEIAFRKKNMGTIENQNASPARTRSIADPAKLK